MSILDTDTLLNREILTPSKAVMERFGFEKDLRDSYAYWVRINVDTSISILRVNVSSEGKILVHYLGTKIESHCIHFEDELIEAINRTIEYHKKHNPYRLKVMPW